jgi:hypothetical protein
LTCQHKLDWMKAIDIEMDSRFLPYSVFCSSCFLIGSFYYEFHEFS